MVLLAELFGVSICCVSAFIGLAIKDEESVQAFGLIWLFPLTFVSSAFVPIATMPGWMQAFANHQPVTLVINSMRALALGGPLHAVALGGARLAGRGSSWSCSRRWRCAPTAAPPDHGRVAPAALRGACRPPFPAASPAGHPRQHGGGTQADEPGSPRRLRDHGGDRALEVEAADTVDLERHVVGLRLRIGGRRLQVGGGERVRANLLEQAACGWRADVGCVDRDRDGAGTWPTAWRGRSRCPSRCAPRRPPPGRGGRADHRPTLSRGRHSAPRPQRTDPCPNVRCDPLSPSSRSRWCCPSASGSRTPGTRCPGCSPCRRSAWRH